MKYIITTLLLIFCLQVNVNAQPKRAVHRRTHHKKHQRTHHRQTYYRSAHAEAATPPSPYKGENTPINDGQKKNKERNLNYNSGQSLPPNNGGR